VIAGGTGALRYSACLHLILPNPTLAKRPPKPLLVVSSLQNLVSDVTIHSPGMRSLRQHALLAYANRHINTSPG